MKNLLIITLIFGAFFLAGCGGGDDPYIPPIEPPPIVDPPPVDPPAANLNTVGFSCASVDNDQVCSGIEDAPAIWNSGPVVRTGDPNVYDYINIELLNDGDIPVSVFAYTMVTINGCGDNPVAWDVVDLEPGESSAFSYLTQNYRCGDLGYQELEVMLYNASGFDPADYANPWVYPRTDLIVNAIVHWDNRLIGDMP